MSFFHRKIFDPEAMSPESQRQQHAKKILLCHSADDR